MKEKQRPIVGKYIQILTNKGYSNCTINNYTPNVIDYVESHDKNPYKLNRSDLENYLLNYPYSSRSQQNQVISSLKLFYKHILNIGVRNINGIERPRKAKTLPKVIDSEYLIAKLNSIKNLKHKTLLKLTYSVGLRVSDVINLKISDIDSKRMIIHIKNGKGNKDRIVPLKQPILDLLRLYYKEYKPVLYLFNGQTKAKYTASSCNKIVKRYLGDQYHIHQLRHSSATYMLENGTDLKTISDILGHSSTRTTEIYTHISVKQLHNASLPM